jgi:hypothetical protein
MSAIFNNISVILWRSVFLWRKPEYPVKTTDMWLHSDTLSWFTASSLLRGYTWGFTLVVYQQGQSHICGGAMRSNHGCRTTSICACTHPREPRRDKISVTRGEKTGHAQNILPVRATSGHGLGVCMRKWKLCNTRSNRRSRDHFGSVLVVFSTTSASYNHRKFRVLYLAWLLELALVICPFYFRIVSK